MQSRHIFKDKSYLYNCGSHINDQSPRGRLLNNTSLKNVVLYIYIQFEEYANRIMRRPKHGKHRYNNKEK